MVKSHRGAGADRSGNRPGVRSRVAGSRGILGRTGDRGSLLRPARRRLMGLGDKTATARRPELAGQPPARSVNPSSKRYLQTHTPGEGPALRPALQTSQAERREDKAVFSPARHCVILSNRPSRPNCKAYPNPTFARDRSPDAACRQPDSHPGRGLRPRLRVRHAGASAETVAPGGLSRRGRDRRPDARTAARRGDRSDKAVGGERLCTCQGDGELSARIANGVALDQGVTE